MLTVLVFIEGIPLVLRKFRDCFYNQRRKKALLTAGVAGTEQSRTLALIAATAGGLDDMTHNAIENGNALPAHQVNQKTSLSLGVADKYAGGALSFSVATDGGLGDMAHSSIEMDSVVPTNKTPQPGQESVVLTL